jgi:succinate dehydrogenase / fumarate reductase, flavoprotein subunit
MRTIHETIRTPVLVIGAGAAGLRTAIELVGRGVDCLVLGKRRHGDAHTRMAAGGINASLGTRDGEDDWQLHAADTLREGHFVCDPHAVELLCREAPARVRELRAWGCGFSETAAGEIDQRYFGAQSYRRTCFVGDRTGEAVLGTLVERAAQVGVQWRENVFITRILVEDGRASGALGFDAEGRIAVFHASAVVLAAGGCTSAYNRSSSRRDENNGDAVALAWRAGAVLRDMEFVQFHPTGRVVPREERGRLVSEAVRGEGGRLFNAAGERFMERYSPERLELDARDVVARAIYREIRAGRGTADGGVLLDASHLDAALVHERLPQFVSQFEAHDVDVTREAVQVAPTAHYAMGGIAVDFTTGATTVPGLYAVGEATAGVHGANRLGGNSLAETVVFGRITGAHLADTMARRARREAAVAGGAVVRAAVDELAAADGEDPFTLADEVGEVLWLHAGIVRSGEGLTEGLERLAALRARAADARGGGAPGSAALRAAFELRAMLVAAEAILCCARFREESRGAHYREDMPEEDAAWRRTVLCERGADGRLRLRTRLLQPVAPELHEALERQRAVEYHHVE